MFLKSSLIFSFTTFISRIFGFVRDSLIAANFGTGIYADAFSVGYKLPNLFRGILAEGAFSAAFVPMFSGKLEKDGKESALEFASRILGILTIILIVIVSLMEILTPFIIMGIAPGFESDSYKFNLTVYITRIITPYIFFISIVTFYACILNSFGKFFSMAASPIVFNIVTIAGLYFFGNTQEEKAFVGAWAVFVAGLAQLAIIIYAIIRRDLWVKPVVPSPTKDPNIKQFFKNITPAAFSSGISQINLWIGTIYATSISGAVSIIYYADRLVQFPISLIGVSIGIVILPSLSKSFKTKDMQRSLHIQNRSLEISLLLSLPCMVAMFVLAEPMIYILFQRGAFMAEDTAKTIPALITLSAGIPAYVMNKIMVSSFFANEDTKTPLGISIVCVVINVLGNMILIDHFAHVGITIATALTAWVNIALLITFAYRKQIFKFDATIKIKIVKILISSIVLYIFLTAALGILEKYLGHDKGALYMLSLFVIIISGAVTFLFTAYSTNTYSIRELREMM